MSDKEMEVLEQEDQQVDEAKASFGVNAEVPEPTTKEVELPTGAGKDVDKNSNPTQGSSVPKTKVAFINAIVDAVKGMSTNELKAAYGKMTNKMEEVESEESQSTTSLKELKQISIEDVDVSEDVTAMFGGEELSEEFVTKATTIFEAAVVSKVNEILEAVTIDLEGELEAEKEGIVEELSTRLDDYLEYVAEEWMKENELAVEQGIRSEIVENFMTGLRDLFEEHYIDIPEDKVDIVEELANKVEELEESVNEQMERNIELRKDLIEAKSAAIIRTVCEGLTESQVAKMESLAEGVEFESAEDYAEKLETIRENYFPQGELSESVVIDEDPIELDDENDSVTDPGMQVYMDAIARSIKK